MAISEAARADLYTGLAEVLGPERAETLMTQLPRYDPVDVVTNDDLLAMESRLNQRFDGFDERMDRFEKRMDTFDKRMDTFEMRMDGLTERLDRFFLTLLAGLFVVVAAMAGVVFASL